MRIAALLPHVEVFGGVRRYLELGNALTRRGHTFVLFTPKGEKPDWLEFSGISRGFEALDAEDFDVGLCSEYSILSQFDRLKAKAKFFYFVLEGHKKEKEVARGGYFFLGSSEGICRRMERKYGISCLRAAGGVNPEIFYPLSTETSPARLSPQNKRGEGQVGGGQSPASQSIRREFKILCYGRIYKKRKGVRHVIKAVEKLRNEFPGLRLIFFDSRVGEEKLDPRPLIKTPVSHDFYLDLPQDKMAWLFSQADLFASAERRAGWANTAAEAMACRLPVVCTASGAQDFAVHEKTALVVPFAHSYFLGRRIRRLILDPDLRSRLAQAGYEKIQEFAWTALAERLEAIFTTVLKSPGDTHRI